MESKTKNAVMATENVTDAAPEEKKILKRILIFLGQEYDLNNLTAGQKEYLKRFPDEVPFVK